MMAPLDIEILRDKIFSLESHIERLEWRFRCPKCGYGLRSTALGDLRPREVILHFLKQTDAPISIASLKGKIAEGGYPMERFGPRHKYFYTLIGRLCESNRAMRNGDEIMMAG